MQGCAACLLPLRHCRAAAALQVPWRSRHAPWRSQSASCAQNAAGPCHPSCMSHYVCWHGGLATCGFDRSLLSLPCK